MNKMINKPSGRIAAANMNRVLIIDDETDINDILSTRLKRIPEIDDVVTATCGEDGVEDYEKLLAAEEPPILVVMDLKLPGIDGVEATKRIIEMDPTATIFGFTAYFGTEWARELEEAGAQKVFSRATALKEFVTQVKKFLLNR